MGRPTLYALFGIVVLGAAALAEFTGWTIKRPAEQRATPRSIRENPGAYRPVYGGSYRYLRGK
ncbi:MAG TPA: hypothetical protein VEZ47_01005 [Gemmatirosa sp.]|nr:hypothetical protein [Gemmatirosa sp.]